jgi:hypothetical protein
MTKPDKALGYEKEGKEGIKLFLSSSFQRELQSIKWKWK